LEEKRSDRKHGGRRRSLDLSLETAAAMTVVNSPSEEKKPNQIACKPP
jgi:hypothetical protein